MDFGVDAGAEVGVAGTDFDDPDVDFDCAVVFERSCENANWLSRSRPSENGSPSDSNIRSAVRFRF